MGVRDEIVALGRMGGRTEVCEQIGAIAASFSRYNSSCDASIEHTHGDSVGCTSAKKTDRRYVAVHKYCSRFEIYLGR